ncbi:MAG: SpoIIIAH-like family protein [Defluviitaleaceae bacterium]|nr:SpoIIIAH-like family protein [Defluviitaleaceae bacterium]
MKRNTYVTAGLFVLFGLLTITYLQMGEREETQFPIVGTLNPIGDVATIGDVVEAEEEEAGVAADAETSESEEADEETEAMAEGSESDEETNESDQEVISRISALRASMEEGRTQQVTALTEIIASADYDAMMKNAAKETLNELQTLANSSRMLETVISHMGFDDVLVDATVDSIRVTVQVASLEEVPTREALAELYVLAGIEFGAHRNGHISIDFQPLN